MNEIFETFHVFPISVSKNIKETHLKNSRGSKFDRHSETLSGLRGKIYVGDGCSRRNVLITTIKYESLAFNIFLHNVLAPNRDKTEIL